MDTRAPYYPVKTCTEVGNGYWRFAAYGVAVSCDDEGESLSINADPGKDYIHDYYIRKEYKYGIESFCIYSLDVLGETDQTSSLSFLWDTENLEEALRWLHKHTDEMVLSFTKSHKLDVARANQWHPEASV